MVKEFHSIQYLRGVAALMVVFVHFPIQLAKMGYSGGWPTFLDSGVDVFFIISGFIMWMTTFDSALTGQQFLSRRFVRIAPLYWVLTSLTVIIMFASPTLVRGGSFDLYHIVTSYLFIPSQNPVTYRMEPVLVVGWTLNYEMFFYLIFALCLSLRTKYRALALTGVLAGLVTLRYCLPPMNGVEAYYTESIILEFAFGVILGALITRGWILPGGIAIALILLGFIAIGAKSFYVGIPRVLSYGVPATMIVAGAVAYESRRAVGRVKFLHTIGDASYSIYLSHGIVLSAAGKIWLKIGVYNNWLGLTAFVLVSLSIVTVSAVVVYQFLECPLIKTFRQWRQMAHASTHPQA